MSKAINLSQLSKVAVSSVGTVISTAETVVELSSSFVERQKKKAEVKKQEWELQGLENYRAELQLEFAQQHKNIVEQVVELGLEESMTALQNGEKLSFSFSK